MEDTPRQTQPAILVFLPRLSGDFIASRLLNQGYAATCVSTTAELEKALSKKSWSLAVTTRSDIDVVLGLEALPVVNIEIFFHGSPGSDELQAGQKAFDGRAFMERIRLLAEQRRRHRPAPSTDALSATAAAKSRTMPGWSSAIRQVVASLRTAPFR